ncbi:DUF397 domain-containing protein [Saccharothrix deserti]|uniref:DUF397 domain-containing protein n=1 Tax=Saccharothrix deserti TaxID=2593674 RepID=UPI00131D56E2|nr:DUF397 domain-containing protein [Saccharothrix deserti]
MENVQWRKSSRSVGNPEQCVEVAHFADAVAVRDSKKPDGPMLRFEPARFGAFLGSVQLNG